MSNHKAWAYNALSNQETILCIDSRSLLLVYSVAKKLLGNYQLNDGVTVKLVGDFGLEIKTETQHGLNARFEFESTEIRDDFASRMKRAGKKHEKIMQGILMEISIQKTFFLKYNYKNSKQSKKYFWFSSDLSEIRWAPAINSKKFSKVSVFEIHNIVYGPWSRNFQRVHKGKSLPYHLCLTIETYKKTIDLQAVEEKQVKLWLSCLYHIIQTKNIPTQSNFTINRFPFLCFRLKVSQVAHKLGLTFHTYLKLKLNKIIYNLNSSSSVTTNRAPSSDQNSSRLSQLQEKIKRSFVSHKRTSTLPMRPGSYDDKHNTHFGSQVPYIGSLYTDRRSQLNEFSRHSSASNVSLHYPLSQRVEHPCSYSTNSTNQNYHQSKTIDVDYGVDNRRSMTHTSIIRTVPLKSEQKSNDSIPSQWSPNPHENRIQPLSGMKHSILEKTSTRIQTRPQEASMNLYFNMDGSKEISNVLPHSHIDNSTSGKILPDNLNLDFAKMTSPPPASNNQTIKSEIFNSGARKSSPLSSVHLNEVIPQRDTNENSMREGNNMNNMLMVDKENVSPNHVSSKKNSARPRMMPLNLKKALNQKLTANEKKAEHREPNQSITESMSISKVEHEPNSLVNRSIPFQKTGQMSFEDVSPIREQASTQSTSFVKKPYFAIEKTLEKSAEKSGHALQKTQTESSGSQLLKKKVKLSIDKNALKNKLLQALHSSQTPPTYHNSNMANQSFAYEVIPANLSIDVSKIDLDLETTTKSKVSFQEDRGENQCTSRFRGGENSEDFSAKKREPYMQGKPSGEEAQHEKHLMFIKNLTSGGKNEKMHDLSDTTQKKPKFNLSLDTSLINLESENTGLRQQLEEAGKEKDRCKEKVAELEQQLGRLKQNMENELQKKDVYIESLLKNIDSLTEDRDSLFNRMSDFMKQNHTLIERENNRKKEVYESGEKKDHEITRLHSQIEALDGLNRKLTHELEMSKRNNCELQAETQRRKESEKGPTYKKKIFSPPASADFSGVSRIQGSKDELAALKAELEKERHFGLMAIEENKKLKHENDMIKRAVKSKLGHIRSSLSELKTEKERLKGETEENYQSFQEVWPHLLNIYEYQSSQNMTLEVKCFTLSKENQLLRAQLKKKIESSE